jgi:hypothetical protein
VALILPVDGVVSLWLEGCVLTNRLLMPIESSDEPFLSNVAHVAAPYTKALCGDDGFRDL